MNAKRCVAAFTGLALLSGCATPESGWTPLFDGHSLSGWKESGFGGAGKVEVVDGRLLLGQGSPMTGVTWVGGAERGVAGDFPRDDYELELDAARLLGTDFFCGLTFPVGDTHLTLVLGGWGGSLCGLSCLDGNDAANNETKSFHSFERGRSYHVRLLVAAGRVQAWLDGAPLVDVETRGRFLSLPPEVEPCRPLGIASYSTQAAITNIRWRRTSAPAGGAAVDRAPHRP